MEHVLEDKEEGKLRDHGLPRRERHLPSAHTKRFSDGVEKEDLLETELTQLMNKSTGMDKWRAYGWATGR